MMLRKRINPARRIASGFALLIFAGAFLFMLPISSKTREVTPFLTALFTSTSATCVTGLSLINPGAYLSLFGQIVLLVLIQLGGLGFMTIFTFVFFISNKQIGLRNRMMIAQTMGTDSLDGVVRLAKHVLCITGIVEGIGAIVLMIRFVPRFGVLKGIWYGIFHSVSAFCNAGFDLIGDGKSMLSYRYDGVVLVTLALLIIIGGLGFVVWEDILTKKSFKKLGMYSKAVLAATAILLVLGTVVYLVLEYNNPDTIANDTTGQKVLASFFQSVTTRTAGFDALVQNNLTELSKVWGIVLMMIGGASGSTAGGIKVGTMVLVLMTVVSVLKSRQDVVISGRRVAHSIILHAMSILVLWLMLVGVGTALVALVEGQPFVNSMYEIASAYSTVGLTVGISETASVFTKILLIVYMFFGRVGIMTISVMFMTRNRKLKEIRYPDGNFIVG